MKKDKGFLIFVIFMVSLMILLSLPYEAEADSIDINLISKHSNDKYNFNEENLGLGYTKDFDRHWQGKVGFYRNSYNKQSEYAMINLKHDQKDWMFGIQFGFVTGYDDIESMKTTKTESYVDNKHKHRNHSSSHKDKVKTRTVVTSGSNIQNLNKYQFMILPNITWKITKEHRLQLGVLPALTKDTVSLYTVQYQYHF